MSELRVLQVIDTLAWDRPRLGWRQDKGHQACAAAFLTAIRSGGPSPIPFEEIVEVSRTAIALA